MAEGKHEGVLGKGKARAGKDGRMIGYPEDQLKVVKLEKFVRKVARILLIDIDIATGGINSYYEGVGCNTPKMVREKLIGLVREAKVLTGKVKIKKEC